MRLSVVIPAYNEVDTLSSLVWAVKSSGVSDLQLIVVDDIVRWYRWIAKRAAWG